MCGVEEERARHGVLLALRGEHPLRDVAAAPRFGTGIPDRPPLYGEWNDEHRERERPVPEVGDEVELRGVDSLKQPGESADLRLLQRKVRRGERAGHRDAELDEIGDEHAPESGRGREGDVDHGADGQRLPHRPAQHHVGDLHGGEVHRRHDHQVEKEAEVQRAKSAHERGRLARVADLVELEIGEHVRASPESRVEEHSGHAGEQEGPPGPVVRHSVLAN